MVVGFLLLDLECPSFCVDDDRSLFMSTGDVSGARIEWRSHDGMTISMYVLVQDIQAVLCMYIACKLAPGGMLGTRYTSEP